jgi:hypothetical protein
MVVGNDALNPWQKAKDEGKMTKDRTSSDLKKSRLSFA